uniref:ananain-like n=1 Tax=Fragaria vesca subsp. vesca TaxID=101020 RepID=UPI0005C96455|nr:PREDICTED: ananain-like [Fragaria vesca subsp. vesca]
MILLIVFSATLAVCQPPSASSLEQNNPANISQIFEDWMAKHNRVYSTSEEKTRRFEIFKAKYLYVQKFNNEGGHTWTAGLNAFSDQTTAEFSSRCCGRRPSRLRRRRYDLKPTAPMYRRYRFMPRRALGFEDQVLEPGI